MKYDSGAPLVCMMTQSTCYRQTSKMTIKGVLWHSTGANNPWLKRYVQPDDNAPDREELLALLGKNPYNNDWNHKEVDAGLNAWIGKLDDGSVASVQTMPWDFKPWGCGGGCNNGWIQFEICEDNLNDSNYFNQVYREACELTAYLCKKFGIDPYGKVGNVPTILCHQDSYQYGMGSNHADVYHWFGRYGKTMDSVRDDVAELLDAYPDQPIEPDKGVVCAVELPVLKIGNTGAWVKLLQRQLIAMGKSCGCRKNKYGIEEPDGQFGPTTEKSVKELQGEAKIGIDGIAGQETWPVALNF